MPPTLSAGATSREYLAELAAEVDRRMRELAGHAVTADTGQLAILVALNLADELSRNREQHAAGSGARSRRG